MGVNEIICNGSTPDVWENSLNWTPNFIPNGFNIVTIPVTSNNPIISYDPVISDIIIETGATLTIKPIGSMDVTKSSCN